MRSNMKRWRLQHFPPNPSSINQVQEQLRDGNYNRILRGGGVELTAHAVTDENGFVHIIFYDREFILEYMSRVKRLFIDGTFQCRPNIKDIMQLLNILGIRAGCVSEQITSS